MALTEVRDEVCTDCGGSGWVHLEGPEDRVRPCSCRHKKSAERLFREAEVPERYQHCRLSSFDTTGHEQLLAAYKACQIYVDRFLSEDPERRFRDSGLLFSGRAGAGKTHLAVAVLYELISSYRVRGRFVDFTSLTQRLQSSLDPSSSDSTTSILRPLEDAELLVVDELGTGSPKLVSWTNEVSYSLINTRYQRRLPTLFTTNYRLEEVEQKSAEWGSNTHRLESLPYRTSFRLVSRLYEMARPIDLFAVDDFRRQVRAHNQDA